MGQFVIGVVIIALGGVLVWLGGHLATEGWKKWQQPQPIGNVVDEQNSKNLDKSQTAPPLEFRGLSAKQALERARQKATYWKNTATLKALYSNRWKMYGDPETQKVSAIEITEWRFIYSDSEKAVGFVVTQNDVHRVDEEIPKAVWEGSPIENWNLDVGEALNIAGKTGINIRAGPNLRMFRVQGKMVPVWIVPGLPPVMVNARNGRLVLEKDVSGMK